MSRLRSSREKNVKGKEERKTGSMESSATVRDTRGKAETTCVLFVNESELFTCVRVSRRAAHATSAIQERWENGSNSFARHPPRTFPLPPP